MVRARYLFDRKHNISAFRAPKSSMDSITSDGTISSGTPSPPDSPHYYRMEESETADLKPSFFTRMYKDKQTFNKIEPQRLTVPSEVIITAAEEDEMSKGASLEESDLDDRTEHVQVMGQPVRRISRKEAFELQTALIVAYHGADAVQKQCEKSPDRRMLSRDRKDRSTDVDRNEKSCEPLKPVRRLSRRESYEIQKAIHHSFLTGEHKNEQYLSVRGDACASEENGDSLNTSLESTCTENYPRTRKSSVEITISDTRRRRAAVIVDDFSDCSSEGSCSPTSMKRPSIASTSSRSRSPSPFFRNRFPSVSSLRRGSEPVLGNISFSLSGIRRSVSDSPSRLVMRLLKKFRKQSQNSQTSEEDDNGLHYAVANNNAILVARILEDEPEIDVNKTQAPGVTALHQACVFGNSDIVKLLLENGADVNKKTWSNLSPINIAASFGHFEVASLLIEHGADCADIKDGISS